MSKKYEHTSDINIKRHKVSGVYYYVRGRIEESLRTDDRNEACEQKQLKVAESRSAGTVAFRFKVAKLYPKYRAYKEKQRDGKIPKKKQISPDTFREIEYAFENHILKHFGKLKLAKVTTPAWSKYCDRATVSDLANHRKVFSGFLKWCKKEGYLLSLPDITEIPYHKRRQRRIVKPQELEKIFKHAKGGLRVFLTLALYNGLRRKEIMTLKWSNVNLDERYLVVESGFNKLRRGRSIPINEIVVQVLKDWRDVTTTSQWVFPNQDDSKRHAYVSGFRTAWNTVLSKSHLHDITWHDFRATYEKYAHKSKDHTDTQREKFADSSTEVQKKIYVSMDHEDLRGLESVVDLPDVAQIILSGDRGIGKPTGGTK